MEETRITSPTGGQKGDKIARIGDLDPAALLELAKVAGYGAGKYAPHNFLRGYDWSLCYNALHRHLIAFWDGEDRDPESEQLHLAHAAWHCLALISFSQREIGTDDRPGKTLQKADLDRRVAEVYSKWLPNEWPTNEPDVTCDCPDCSKRPGVADLSELPDTRVVQWELFGAPSNLREVAQAVADHEKLCDLLNAERPFLGGDSPEATKGDVHLDFEDGTLVWGDPALVTAEDRAEATQVAAELEKLKSELAFFGQQRGGQAPGRKTNWLDRLINWWHHS